MAITAIFGVSLIASFRLGSRTLVVISFVSLLAAFGYILSKQSLLQNMKLFISALGIVLLIYIFIPIDLDSPIFSTLGQRLQNQSAIQNTATAGDRTGLWAAGVEKLFENPLGWKYQRHHHNLWLDMAKDGTFIPLLFFLINNVLCYFGLRKVFKVSGNDVGLNVTFLLVILSTYLLFFTEPVIEGNFFSIVLYCLFYGIMIGYAENREKVLESQPDAS
jgi:hypothetical protein